MDGADEHEKKQTDLQKKTSAEQVARKPPSEAIRMVETQRNYALNIRLNLAHPFDETKNDVRFEIKTGTIADPKEKIQYNYTRLVPFWTTYPENLPKPFGFHRSADKPCKLVVHLGTMQPAMVYLGPTGNYVKENANGSKAVSTSIDKACQTILFDGRPEDPSFEEKEDTYPEKRDRTYLRAVGWMNLLMKFAFATLFRAETHNKMYHGKSQKAAKDATKKPGFAESLKAVRAEMQKKADAYAKTRGANVTNVYDDIVHYFGLTPEEMDKVAEVEAAFLAVESLKEITAPIRCQKDENQCEIPNTAKLFISNRLTLKPDPKKSQFTQKRAGLGAPRPAITLMSAKAASKKASEEAARKKAKLLGKPYVPPPAVQNEDEAEKEMERLEKEREDERAAEVKRRLALTNMREFDIEAEAMGLITTRIKGSLYYTDPTGVVKIRSLTHEDTERYATRNSILMPFVVPILYINNAKMGMGYQQKLQEVRIVRPEGANPRPVHNSAEQVADESMQGYADEFSHAERSTFVPDEEEADGSAEGNGDLEENEDGMSPTSRLVKKHNDREKAKKQAAASAASASASKALVPAKKPSASASASSGPVKVGEKRKAEETKKKAPAVAADAAAKKKSAAEASAERVAKKPKRAEAEDESVPDPLPKTDGAMEDDSAEPPLTSAGVETEPEPEELPLAQPLAVNADDL